FVPFTLTIATPVQACPDVATVDAGSGSLFINVLANDQTSPPGRTLTLASFTQPANGSVVQSGNNVFYTPNANFYGVDSFSYTAQDAAGNSSTASVTVIVRAVPRARSDSYAMSMGDSLNVSAPGVLSNDSVISGNVLSAALVSGTGHGTLTLNSVGSCNYD